MRVKRLLCSILALAMILSTMSFTAFAAGDTDAANAVASIDDQYYSTVALAMADAQANDTIVIHKEINDTDALTAPTVAPLTFKAATNGIKITGRAYLPKTAISGVITYDGFDFTGNTDWTVQQWDGPEKLNDVELVYKNCNFGAKGICISWHQDKPDWNLKKITLDNCTAEDGKEVFSFQYVDEVIIKNCDFSNATDRLINVSAASGDVTVNECNFGEGAIQLSQNVGTEERNLTVENSTFTGDKAVVIHENLTNASTQLGTVELTNNTVEETTELINFKDEAVIAEEYIKNNTSSVIAAGNETVSGEAVTEISTGYTPAAPVASIDGKYYVTLAEAVKNATDADNDGVVTINIYGKAEIGATFQINVACETVNIVGATDDAEIYVTAKPSDNGVVYVANDAIEYLNFSNLTLNRPNGEWRGNEGHHNRFFTVWDSNGSTDLISYTNCVFPNGAGNNQYGKTTYTDCTFNNDVYYALWIYGSGDKGVVEVTGGKFNADRGVKIYSEDASATVSTTITDSTFAIDSKPAIVSSIAGELVVEDVDATACEYGLLASEPKDGRSDLVSAAVTVDGETPVFVAKVGNMVCTDIDYAEAEKSDTKPIEIPVASIGTKYYGTLADAVAALEDGDTLKIATGTYDAFEVLADNITITGMTDDAVVTVGSTTDTAFIGVGGHNFTVEGIKFVVPEEVGGKKSWCTSVVGFASSQYNYGGVEPNGWDVIDCDFVQKGNALGIAIFNVNDFEVTGCTFENFGTGIAVMNDGSAPAEVNVSDNTFANVAEFFTGYWGATANATSSVVIDNNKATDGSTTVITVFDYAKATIGADATAFTNVTATDNDAKVILVNYDTNDYVSDITNNTSVVYTYNTKELLDAVDYPETKVYVGYNTDAEVAYLFVDGELVTAPDAIAVEFEIAEEKEGEKTYNINLTTDDEKIINRLNSVDLTFLLTQVNGENDFEIIASNSEVAINPVDNSKNRYEFHYNGKTDVTTDTDTSITIGQVKFTGYGEFSFAVNANATTNAAHATTIDDNIVDTFIPDGDTTVLTNGELVIDNATTGNVAIAVPDRNLKINIDFPNAVADQVIAYQDMKVVISGGDLAEDIIVDLGNDAVETALDIFGKEAAKYSAEMEDGSYVINVTDALTLNNAYTVTVSGAGYRTARYTVTMTEDKTLRFWNNVMDEVQFVEIGKESSKVNVTFLAGDIVKDNNINIYDLSAVVSYFGTETDTDAYDAYAKYDLNRDGVIDSKDVAYVLVSWNN